MKISDQKFLESLGIDVKLSDFYDKPENQTHLIDYFIDATKEAFNQMEQSVNSYKEMDEDGLSNIAALSLNSRMSLSATREENSNGHVDITVTAPNIAPLHTFSIMGEAKIWKGVKYALRGLQQIGNYLTGRVPYAFMYHYFKIDGCDLKVDELYTAINQAPNTKEVTKVTGRHFSTQIEHTSGSIIRVDHFALNLYNPKF